MSSLLMPKRTGKEKRREKGIAYIKRRFPSGTSRKGEGATTWLIIGVDTFCGIAPPSESFVTIRMYATFTSWSYPAFYW